MKDYHLRMARLNWLFFCRVRNSQVKVCKKYICWKIRKLYPCETWWVYYIFYCTIRHSSRHCNNCKQPCSNCSSFPFHWVKGGGGKDESALAVAGLVVHLNMSCASDMFLALRTKVYLSLLITSVKYIFIL